MPKNIEIKARLHDPDHQCQLAASLVTAPVEVVHQHDTFFDVPSGRLKLRQQDPGGAQLIFYHREDLVGPKLSNYLIAATDEPQAMHILLARTLGIRGEVRKCRKIYIAGQTRIHIDQVEHLGIFAELEVVLGANETAEEGCAIANRFMVRLDIRAEDLIPIAYCDLLNTVQAVLAESD